MMLQFLLLVVSGVPKPVAIAAAPPRELYAVALREMVKVGLDVHLADPSSGVLRAEKTEPSSVDVEIADRVLADMWRKFSESERQTLLRSSHPWAAKFRSWKAGTTTATRRQRVDFAIDHDTWTATSSVESCLFFGSEAHRCMTLESTDSFTLEEEDRLNSVTMAVIAFDQQIQKERNRRSAPRPTAEL